MKGAPQEPRCGNLYHNFKLLKKINLFKKKGFSRQIVEILKNNNVTFSYFDILSDNDVREGLKKYSNWPTYPQLYIKG